jgi:hypothetical protein
MLFWPAGRIAPSMKANHHRQALKFALWFIDASANGASTSGSGNLDGVVEYPVED